MRASDTREAEVQPRLCERVEVGRGEVVCRAGERLNALFLIRSGRVEVAVGSRRQVLGPGQFFGALRFGQARRSRWTARALEHAALLRIDGRTLGARLGNSSGALKIQGLEGWEDRLIFRG